SQSWLWHHRDEFVEHGTLTKQRMRALFGGVGFEITVIPESLTCSSEQCQQDDGKSIQQPKPVPPFRRADSYRSHPHAQPSVLRVSEGSLNASAFSIGPHQLLGGVRRSAGSHSCLWHGRIQRYRPDSAQP